MEGEGVGMAAAAGIEPITAMRLEPSLKPAPFWRDVKQLRELGQEFDLVHVHGDHDMLLARLALGSKAKRAAKIVRSYHKAAPPGPWLLWLHAACADGVVTVSNAQRERFLRRFPSADV